MPAKGKRPNAYVVALFENDELPWLEIAEYPRKRQAIDIAAKLNVVIAAACGHVRAYVLARKGGATWSANGCQTPPGWED